MQHYRIGCREIASIVLKMKDDSNSIDSNTNCIVLNLKRFSPDLSWASDVQRDLLDRMLAGWRAQRVSRGNELDSIEGDVHVVQDFLAHARGLPGQLRPHHFESWCNHLFFDRHVVASTQRKYQSAVRTFFNYVLQEPRFRAMVRQRLHCEPEQVATPDNCIVHVKDRELTRKSSRRSFTDDETAAFFDQIDLQIRLAAQQRSKALHPMQRNKAYFAVVLERGLRADEGLKLDIDSFEHNPARPELGPYGMARVFGKGSKWRTVPMLNPASAQVHDWYISKVRPVFLVNAKADEKALFLAENGGRRSYSAMNLAYNQLRNAAGLPRELVTHCLRHTSVSRDAMSGLSPESNRLRAGHAFQSTNQGYTHFPDRFVQNEFGQAIDRNLAQGQR